MGNGHAPGTVTGLGAAGAITDVTGAFTGFVTGCFAGRLWEAGLAVFFFATFFTAGFLAGFFLAGLVLTAGFFLAATLRVSGFFFRVDFPATPFLAGFLAAPFFLEVAFFVLFAITNLRPVGETIRWNRRG